MKNLKEILKIGFILFGITAVSALLLAVVNSKTAPVIAENLLKRTYEAMEVVMPEAKEFNPVNDENSQIYEASDANGEVIGVCVITAANGYGGEISILTGIDKELKVTGIDILSHSETPGLGANATKPEFKEQYTGKKEGLGIDKNAPGENEIQAMSGATITSTAVTKAVDEALKIAGGVLGE